MEETAYSPLPTLPAVVHQTQELISVFPGKVLSKRKWDLEGKVVEKTWGKLNSYLQIVWHSIKRIYGQLNVCYLNENYHMSP